MSAVSGNRTTARRIDQIAALLIEPFAGRFVLTGMVIRWAGALVCLGSLALAQQSATFEVASIKRHIVTNPGGDDSSTDVSPGGRLVGRNVTARKLLRNSFVIEDSRITGTPGWTDTESYDIDARTAGGVEITRENIQALMLSLLESRFHLEYHRDRKDAPIYTLEVAKGGAKVTPHPADDRPSMSTNSNGATISFVAKKLSMADFAASLARQVGRPVVDKTGLAGNFDFDLKWSTEQAGMDAAGPSVFTSLQGIGLRLVAGKGPIEVIVVDRIERPSEN